MSSILFVLACQAFAQDTLVLINGKELIADSVRIEGYSATLYQHNWTENSGLGLSHRTAGFFRSLLRKSTFGAANKCTDGVKSIDGYRIFSVRYASGTEEVLYRKDPSDPVDFTEEEMRMFIKGEQDAARYYKNNVNKGASFVVGAASAGLAIYGLLVPPLFSTAIGSFTPNMEKQKVSDESLRSNEVYCEGYQRKVRDRKIRNSLVSGLAGFVVGFFAWDLVYN